MSELGSRISQLPRGAILGIAGGAVAIVVAVAIGIGVHMHHNTVARQQTADNLASCQKLQEQITSETKNAGLHFTRYQPRLDAAVAQEKQASEELPKKPQQAAKTSAKAVKGLQELLADVQADIKSKARSLAVLQACKNLEEQVKQEASAAGLEFQQFQADFDAAAAKHAKGTDLLDADPKQSEQVALQAQENLQSLLAFVQRSVQAKADSQKHIANCDALLTQVEAHKASLTEVALKFDPYQERVAAAVTKKQTAQATLNSAPLNSNDLSGKAEGELQALIADLEHAVTLKKDHSAIDLVDGAEKEVAAARQQTVVWKFPGVAAPTTQEHFRYSEKGYNPDNYIKEGKLELAAVSSSLDEGKVADAQDHFNQACYRAADARRCLTSEVAAKERLEAQMAGVQRESENADASRLESIRADYFQQNFISAADGMDSQIQITANRRETREIVSYCQRQDETVSQTMRDNDRFNYASTQQKYRDLEDEFGSLLTSSRQSDPDWAQLKQTAQRLQPKFMEIRDESVQARRDYDEALTAVQQLRRNYDSATSDGVPFTYYAASRHKDISDPVKDGCREVTEWVNQLETNIQRYNQDWRKIRQNAGTVDTTISGLRTMVTEDDRRLERMEVQKARLEGVAQAARYNCTINGNYFVADQNDSDFRSHISSGRQFLDYARRDWRDRASTFESRLSDVETEVKVINSIGWWTMLHTMRNSTDLVVQNAAWDNGYRDNRSRQEWKDGFISRKTTGADGLWKPAITSASGGSADFGPPPDFTAPWAN